MKRIIAIAFALALGSAFAAGGLVRGAAARGANVGINAHNHEYVERGLIFNLNSDSGYDGLTWVDSAGGYTFAMTNTTGGGVDGVYFNGASAYGVSSGVITKDSSIATVEICFKIGASSDLDLQNMFHTGKSKYAVMLTTNNGRLSAGGYDSSGITPTITQPTVALSTLVGKVTTWATSWPDTTTIHDIDGVSVATVTGSTQQGSTHMVLGCLYLNGALHRFFKGSIYSIRMYNRELTEVELMHNYLVDNYKFGLN